MINRWCNDKRPEFALPEDIDFSRTAEISTGYEKRAEFYGKYCRTGHVSQTGAYGETNPVNSALFNYHLVPHRLWR
jgi:hypothetical protein